MAKYAFYIDLSTCAGCESCTVACQNKNGLEPEQRFTKVSRYMTGTFPEMKSTFVINQCMHCDNPPCESVCPTGATYKAPEGPVQVNLDQCIGCRYCITACPYDARCWDEKEHLVKKCTECFDRLSEGKQPACVQTCITAARHVGDLENPDDEIHALIQEPGVFKVEGTSFYFKAPEGIERGVLPADFKGPGVTYAWQSILQPVGQLLMGGAAAAVVVSLVANAINAGKKGENKHGDQ